MTDSNDPPDDRDDHDDQDSDHVAVDDVVDIDVDPDQGKAVTLDLTDADADVGYLVAWAQLFTNTDTTSGAVWEALRRWVWTQTDFEGAVDADDVPPTEKGQERLLHTKAAVDRVNETRLRTMSDLALAKELGVYGDYFERQYTTGPGHSRDDELYRRVAYHLTQAQQILEEHYNYRARRGSDADDPGGSNGNGDTPDTE